MKKLAEWRNGFTSSKRGWSSQTFVFQSGESSRMSQRSVTEIWKLKQKRSSLKRTRAHMVEKAKPKGNWFFFTGTGPTSNLTLEKKNKVATRQLNINKQNHIDILPFWKKITFHTKIQLVTSLFLLHWMCVLRLISETSYILNEKRNRILCK